MSLVERIPAHLRANPEFQSAVVRIGIWLFALFYIGFGAWAGVFEIEVDVFLSLFFAYLVLNLGILFSLVGRPVWEARRYLALSFDIFAVSLALFLVKDPFSPFYLVYIWIFISAGARYGSHHLAAASLAAVVSYNIVLVVLEGWATQGWNAVFHVLVLILLPLYQASLLRKLREAKRAAEQANQAKGIFLANMTHELRTPLTGVLGMANLLRATELSAEQREYADAIASSASTLQALIGDILDLSKIDANKLQLEHKPFALRKTIKEVCEVMHSHALSKGLELICDVAPDLPPCLLGDQLRVRQILFNLIGNAVKFTERGEIRVRARWALPDADPSRAQVVLAVEDTGIGIPADKLPGIFEGFNQADVSTTRRYGGTGLGTTIARDLARLMGGDIAVSSRVDVGTCFSVHLPLPMAAETDAAAGCDGLPAGIPAAAESPVAGLRVLIYERNQTLCDLIASSCEALGMICFVENDIGRLPDAVREASGVDLLILADAPERVDLRAVCKGFQCLLDGSIPALLLTYSQRRSELRQFACPCLNKPFLREDLIAAIHQALHQNDPIAPCPQAPSLAPTPTIAAHGVRVLVAEDNAIAAKVITRLLERQGALVTLVRDGLEALSAARSGQHFDVAFIDLRMPGLDGIGFTEQLRRQEPAHARLPIYALTANAAEDMREQCLAAGMDGFLTKPIDPTALLDTVGRYRVQGERAAP